MIVGPRNGNALPGSGWTRQIGQALYHFHLTADGKRLMVRRVPRRPDGSLDPYRGEYVHVLYAPGVDPEEYEGWFTRRTLSQIGTRPHQIGTHDLNRGD